MAFSTPLRYPGGKGKLTTFIKDVLEVNHLQGGEYAEPYAGGAGIACNLLLQERVTRIHLNDLNTSVYAFWHSVKYQSEALIDLVMKSEVSIDEWFRQRDVQRSGQASRLALGFSTFFLNRTNRSGIIKGGVIGGKHQDGAWSLSARFNKADLVSRIQKLAERAQQIEIYNVNASDFIKRVVPGLPRKTLIYLDPPYFVKGQGLYENHYAASDHAEIASLVEKRLKRPWVVSYDHAPEILQLYKNHQRLIYRLSYSAQDRYLGSEVMFFRSNLIVPTASAPLHQVA